MTLDLNPRNPDNQRALQLRIEHRRNGDSYYVLTLVYMELQAGEIRSGSDSPLECLQVRAQGGDDQPGRLYGWDTTFHNVWEVTLRDAERMLAVLKRLQRELEKARERDGQEQSFGQYLIRVCRALGITSIVYDARKGMDIGTGRTYSVRSVVDGAGFIDRVLMDDWRQAVEKGERVAA